MTQTGSAPIRELARTHFDRVRGGWERGDVSSLDEVYSDDLVYHIPPFPDLDKAGLGDFMTGFHQAFPDFSVEEDELVVDGDTTVQRWHCTGTYTGHSPLLPVPCRDMPKASSTTGTAAPPRRVRGAITG